MQTMRTIFTFLMTVALVPVAIGQAKPPRSPLENENPDYSHGGLNETVIDKYIQEAALVTLKKKELGPIDSWRYESCQKEAAKAPTELGVRVGTRICREKFGQ